ncbi:threonine-phosphate decarboxylase CobD [Acuticoccus sp.]|uniref:threonine-phosphate decarboxylase CobD n=1 Tax=Acuticoccus sp. TaxID=1904378 RepID=UPI003B52543A
MQTGAYGARSAHGGELADAARLVGEPASPWLDLSTGINPYPYPAHIPDIALTRLPQQRDLDRLLEAARRAYRVPDEVALVAAPGTQAIISWLPRLLRPRHVTVLGPTYGEHAAAWSGHVPLREASRLPPDGLAIVVNPNNPDGRVVSRDELAAFVHRSCEEVALVVDEAFGDLDPGATAAELPRTLVLKSFGKFFGLPGLRLGFAVGPTAVVDALRDALGPWAVSGPAIAVGVQALEDEAWAQAMRLTLRAERARLDDVLAAAGLAVAGGTDLFRLVAVDDAPVWQGALAAEGVWTRAFDHTPCWLRVGLPGHRLGELVRALASAGAARR